MTGLGRQRHRRRGSARVALHRAAALTLMTAGLAGCGDGRLTPPSLTTPAAPSGFHTLRFPAAGASLAAPVNWTRLTGRGDLVTVLSSGDALIALWHYPANAALSAAPLAADARALLARARRRDPDLRVDAQTTTTLAGHGAVELDVTGRIDSTTRRILSEHVYAPGGELVLELYAPPAAFARVDRLVFAPVQRSLTLLAGGRA